MNPAGNGFRRIALGSNQEVEADEDSFERGLNPGIESTLGAAFLVRAQEYLYLGLGQRPAIRAASKCRDDLSCARFLISSACRPAYEDGTAARRVTRFRKIWATDGDSIHSRVSIILFVRAPAEVDLRWLYDAFGFPRAVYK